MQETIDPSIGQAEVQQMKKEIHRMELRFDQLKKKQEAMIQEMERSVFKRETIQMKYQKGNEVKKQGKLTQGQLSRQIQTLKNTLKHTTQNVQEKDVEIKGKNEKLNQTQSFIRQRNEEYEEIKGEYNHFVNQLAIKKLAKLYGSTRINLDS